MPSVAIHPAMLLGQSVPCGPSLNLIGKYAWKIPASGAISVIGPSSLAPVHGPEAADVVGTLLVGNAVPFKFSIRPVKTAGPPAVANKSDEPCLVICTATGPCHAPATFTPRISVPIGDTL